MYIVVVICNSIRLYQFKKAFIQLALIDYCAETPRLRNKLPPILNLQERYFLTNQTCQVPKCRTVEANQPKNAIPSCQQSLYNFEPVKSVQHSKLANVAFFGNNPEIINVGSQSPKEQGNKYSNIRNCVRFFPQNCKLFVNFIIKRLNGCLVQQPCKTIKQTCQVENFRKYIVFSISFS